MARVQLIIPDEDRDRFVHQARKEGLTLSAWLRTAAHQRLSQQQRLEPFESPADLAAFFSWCDTLPGPETEPDWEQHLAAINSSRSRGMTDT